MAQQWNSESKDGVRALWNSIKCANILIRGVPDEEERERTENIFENIIAEKSPNLGKQRDTQAQETRSRQSQTGST